MAGNGIVIALAGFITTRILGEFLTKEEFGELSLLLSIGALFSGIVYGGLEQAIARYSSKYQFDKDYIRTVSVVIAFLSLAVLITYFVIVVVIDYKNLAPLYLLGGVLFIFTSINVILNTINNYNFKKGNVLYNSVILLLTKILLLTFIAYFFKLTAYDVIVLSIISAGLVITIQAKQLKLIDNGAFSKQIAQDLAKYSFPFMISGILISLQSIADKWIIEKLLNTSDVALYVLYFQMSYVPSGMLGSILINYIGPIYFKAHDKNQKKINKLVQISIIMASFGLLVVALLNLVYDQIIFILIPSSYLGYKYLFYIFIICGFTQAAAQLLTIEMNASFNIKKLVYIKNILGVFYILYSYYFIYIFGIYGAAYSLLFYNITYYSINYYLVSKNV